MGIRRVASPGAELKKWRARRKLSLRALASRVNCDFGHLGKIENGKATFTQEMAKACDQVLDAGGALIHAWMAAHGSVRPAQLPAAPVHVVGRDAELGALARAVRERPPGTLGVVAIDGPAGAGKTALALRLAHQIAGQYVDGQLYADLGGFAPPGKSVTADVVLEGFLAAMGASSIPDTAAERAGLYRSLLAERNVLIVLDNVADLEDVKQLMPASPGCAVVVTSRRALSSLVTRIGATRVTARPLSEPDSITLVSHVIGEARAAVDADAVTTLTRLCGHLPLALCIAADQIAMYPHRPVVDLVDELIEEEHRLSAWELTDLRAVFSWSYHDLGDDAARLFRLIGLHTGPHLSVAAAAALAGVSMPGGRRLLHRLASLHLVDIDSDQVIRLHGLIGAYARDLVDTDEDDELHRAAVQRLVTWYAATAREASMHLSPHMLEPPRTSSAVDSVTPLVFTDDISAWAWCTTELDNFGAITTLALQYGPPGAAHQLATGLADLGLLDRPADERALAASKPTASPTPGAAGSTGSAGHTLRPDNAASDTVGDTLNESCMESVNESMDDSVDESGEEDFPWTCGRTGHGPPWAGPDGFRWGECGFGGPWRNHGSAAGFGHGSSGGVGEMLHRVARAVWADSDDAPDAPSADPRGADARARPAPWWTEAENSDQPQPSPRSEADAYGAAARSA